MKQIIRLAIISALAAITGAAVLSAPAQQGQPITIGGSVSVSALIEGLEGATPLTLVIEEPTIVSLLATSIDGTNPVFLVLDQYNRAVFTVDDNPSSPLASNEYDAALDDTLLIPGTYTIYVGRNGMDGSGNIDFSVFPGSEGIIGIGSFQLIDAAIDAGQRYVLPLNLNEGELISLAAMGLSEEFDLRLNLRNPEGESVAINDDNETFDIFLTDLDPRIYQYRVPASGTYELTVRAFSSDQAGAFKVVIQRHGVLSGDPRVEVITGVSENRARNAFPIEFSAGEIVRITVRALNASLDPELELLTPDNIFIASNDDHGTEDTDLGRFDARIDSIVIEEAGVYELDVNSVSGRGEFEVTIERLGVFAAAEFPPVDASAAMVRTPAPTVEPEATAEPTSG